ncbi:MAG: osmotically inducible protein OsmC [bacterium]|nr:osmotically inducible protein OsmC [bacterium]
MEITFDGGRIITAHVNGKSVNTDYTTRTGEDFKIPTPYELFLMSIITCAGAKIKMFCEERNISTDNIKITQNIKYDEKNDLPVNIELDVKLPDDFPSKYRKALFQ